MNVGKKFEENFKKSIPSYCMLHRLKDSAMAYNNSKGTKFTWDNPCDFFCFDSKSHFLFAFELKSTKSKSISFERKQHEKSSKMVKYHQISALKQMSIYDGLIAGFIFNFRDEKNNAERTYFQNIIHFDKMSKGIDKTSFNEMDLILNNAVKIKGVRKRINYIWNIDEFLQIYREA